MKLSAITIICIFFILAIGVSAREELYMSGCDSPYRVILEFDNSTFCCIDLDKNDQCDYPIITYQDANNKTVIRYDPVINKTPLPGMTLRPATTSTLRVTTTIPASPTTIRSATPTTLHIPTPTTIGIKTTSSTLSSTQQTVISTTQTTQTTIKATPTTMYNVRPMPTTTLSPDLRKVITDTVKAKDPSGTYTIIAIALFAMIVIATVLYTLGSEE